jgi:hypothetical protein
MSGPNTTGEMEPKRYVEENSQQRKLANTPTALGKPVIQERRRSKEPLWGDTGNVRGKSAKEVVGFSLRAASSTWRWKRFACTESLFWWWLDSVQNRTARRAGCLSSGALLIGQAKQQLKVGCNWNKVKGPWQKHSKQLSECGFSDSGTHHGGTSFLYLFDKRFPARWSPYPEKTPAFDEHSCPEVPSGQQAPLPAFHARLSSNSTVG